MTIIKPYVTIVDEVNPFKKIEMAARTCYKSEAAITDSSAEKMFDRLASSQHTAMMEHATFVFAVSDEVFEKCLPFKYLNCTTEDYSTGLCRLEDPRNLVSGNLRAINESRIVALLDALYLADRKYVYVNGYTFDERRAEDCEAKLIDFEELENKTPNEIAAHRYTTMRFTTDRGVTHEIVRHRPFSFAQESTRYVMYSKEKFGGGDIKFIEPAGYDTWSVRMKTAFERGLYAAEEAYNAMTAEGATAQQARAVLPNAVKTEIVVTGNDAEWQHFFNLRSKGTTGAPHPDMKRVADMALELYEAKYNG